MYVVKCIVMLIASVAISFVWMLAAAIALALAVCVFGAVGDFVAALGGRRTGRSPTP